MITMCSNCVFLLNDLREVGKQVDAQLAAAGQENKLSGAHCLRCGDCGKIVGVDNKGDYYVEEFEEHMRKVALTGTGGR